MEKRTEKGKSRFNLVDFHTHPYSHGDEKVGIDWINEFLQRAENRGLKELGFSDHDFLLDKINWDLLTRAKCESNISVRLGLEIGFRPEKKDYYKKIVDEYPLDFCIGSVHFIDDWNFDHPDYIEKFKERPIDQIYRDYFALVFQALQTDLFDIVGHIDLIKIFNYFPQKKDVLDYMQSVLALIKQKELVVEINTNGLNKPVAQYYPSKKIIKKLCENEIDITLGSDAHSPDRVGENLSQVAFFLKKIGFKRIAVFNKREKSFLPLG